MEVLGTSEPRHPALATAWLPLPQLLSTFALSHLSHESLSVDLFKGTWFFDMLKILRQ